MSEPLDLRAAFSPHLIDALEQLVDERVAAALAEKGDDSQTWLSVAEAAEYLRVSQRLVHKLIKEKRLRATYLGRRCLLDRHDLDATLRER